MDLQLAFPPVTPFPGPRLITSFHSLQASPILPSKLLLHPLLVSKPGLQPVLLHGRLIYNREDWQHGKCLPREGEVNDLRDGQGHAKVGRQE